MGKEIPSSLLSWPGREREAVFTFCCLIAGRRRRNDDVEKEKGEARGVRIPIDDHTGVCQDLKWADKVSSLQCGTPTCRENVYQVVE